MKHKIRKTISLVIAIITLLNIILIGGSAQQTVQTVSGSYTQTSVSPSPKVDLLKFYKTVIGGGTETDKGMAEASKLLLDNNDKHQKICILATDGPPTGATTVGLGFSTIVANRALEISANMKDKGVQIYCLKAFFKLGSALEGDSDTFLQKLSSYYDDTATSMDKGSMTNSNLEPTDFVFNVNDSAALEKKLQQSIITSRLYPFILNSNSVTQDVVTPYFSISNPTYEIQTPVFNSNEKIVSWKTESTGKASVSGQRVYVQGFDYTERFISPQNDNSARLVIKYHIDPNENFLGGNAIPTNIEGSTANNSYSTGGAGIYCAGDFLKSFRNIPVNVKVKELTISNMPDVTVPYKTQINPQDYVVVKELEENIINGINNAFTEIEFTMYSKYENGTNETNYFTIDAEKSNVKNVNGLEMSSYPVTSTQGDLFTLECVGNF